MGAWHFLLRAPCDSAPPPPPVMVAESAVSQIATVRRLPPGLGSRLRLYVRRGLAVGSGGC
jgi:hypothetical protein